MTYKYGIGTYITLEKAAGVELYEIVAADMIYPEHIMYICKNVKLGGIQHMSEYYLDAVATYVNL